jgi:hypothetical protein
MAEPMQLAAMIRNAAIGAGKIDRWGARGATMVNVTEIEAMALLLAALGLPPVRIDAQTDRDLMLAFMVKHGLVNMPPPSPAPLTREAFAAQLSRLVRRALDEGEFEPTAIQEALELELSGVFTEIDATQET